MMFDCSSSDSVSKALESQQRQLALRGKVLAVPVVLKRGEHLRDVVLRAVEQNGFANTSIATDLATTRAFRSVSAFKSICDDEEVGRLIDVLGIDRDGTEVKDLLTRKNNQTRASVSFFRFQLRRSDFAPSRRVSPIALRSSNHQRAIWSIRWFDFDTETLEPLLDKCPVCRRFLGWNRTLGVNNCDHCLDPKVDLRDFPNTPIAPCDIEALEFSIGIIDPEVPDADFFRRWNGCYSAATRSDLFRFLVSLAMECRRQRTHRRDSIGSLSHCDLELAGRALLRWPGNFHDWIERTSQFKGDTRALYGLHKDTLLGRREREELKELMDVHLRRRALAVFQGIERSSKDTQCNAVKVSMRNARVSMMELINSPGYIKNEIEGAVRVVRDIEKVREKSREIGLPVPDIIELYLTSFFPSLSSSLDAIGIPPESDGNLTEDFLSSLRPATVGAGMDLPTLRFLLDRDLSTSWSTILKAVASGTLPVTRLRSTISSGAVQNIIVEDFTAAKAFFAAAPGSRRFHMASLSQTEIGYLLGRSRATASKFLKYLQTESLISTATLATFRETHVFGYELVGLCKIEGLRPQLISDRLRRGRIPQMKQNGLLVSDRRSALECLGLQQYVCFRGPGP